MAEYIRTSAAMRTTEKTHILNHTKNRDIKLSKHGNTPNHIKKGDILRRRNNNSACKRHFLGQGKLNITGSRREVHQEVIKLTPFYISKKLFNCLHNHRSAPDQGGVLRNHKSYGHKTHTVFFYWDQFLTPYLRLFCNPHHDRDTWTINICVQQSYLCTRLSHRDRKAYTYS